MKTRAQELGEAIEKDRARTGVSQEDIAREVGVTQQALSGWEAGASFPRTARLLKLRDFFGPQSATGLVIEHIIPRSQGGASEMSNLSFVSAAVNRSINAEWRPEGEQPREELARDNSQHIRRRTPGALLEMGRQSGSEKETPREDTTDASKQGDSKWNIQSFEDQPDAPRTEIREALARAQNGVQLARQVLDDAATQIAIALNQLSK